jgi:hypothetical protein
MIFFFLGKPFDVLVDQIVACLLLAGFGERIMVYVSGALGLTLEVIDHVVY